MALSQEEQKFIKSVEEKINKWQIKTTLKEAFQYASHHLVYTIYNDKSVDLVDAGVEMYLIKRSFYYFLNKYCVTFLPGVGSFAMSPYYFQNELAKEITTFRKIVADKTRQCGISTIFSYYAFWRAHFFPAENIDVVSVKQIKAREFVNKFRPTLENLPEWMKTPVLADNEEFVAWKHSDGTKSQILSETQSENAGRGDSLSLLIMDEAAHYASDRMVRSIISAAQPALTKTGGQLVIVSTPLGTSGRGAYYYEQVQAAKVANDKRTKYVEIDWWEVPDDAMVDGPKKGYNEILDEAVRQQYYHNKNVKEKYKAFFKPIAKETWKDNDWLRATMDDLGDVKYRQEILHEFIIDGDKVFTEELLEKVESKLKDPIIKDKLGDMNFDGMWIWKKPIPNHRYALGVDVGTGTGNDYSTIEVFDVEDYEQVAEYKGFMSTLRLSMLVKKLARYYNEGFVIIECNSIGEAVFNGVYYAENDPYPNCFKQLKEKNGVSRMTGWLTDTKTRKLIANEFIDWFQNEHLFDTLKMHSKRLWYEMTTWVWKANQKAEHIDNSHDDSIIAFALCLFLRNKAGLSSQSFMIDDKGNVLEYNKSDLPSMSTNDNSFNIVATDKASDVDDDVFQSRYGVNKEEYEWLLQ